ncbi:MAG: hypothetical protein ABIM46_08965, partial [candidate division WOR-3 bacterium]
VFKDFQKPEEKIIAESLVLSNQGARGERAAALEIKALTARNPEKLLEAAEEYKKSYYPVEAFIAALAATSLGFQADSEIFAKGIKFLSSLDAYYPRFELDPLYGDFLKKISPFLKNISQGQVKIRAFLIGEFRVVVNGDPISLHLWEERRAILALIYILLDHKHRIPEDYLCELLWPNKWPRGSKYQRLLRARRNTIVSIIRKHLGDRERKLLIRKGDFYQLEDVWTDLGEIENLMRLADAVRDPAEKEELLARARELAKGELLPEFPYDSHIDEYRQYYNRLRKRLFGDNQT